jgi:hypothetical protein
MPDLSFPIRTQDWGVDVARRGIMTQQPVYITGVARSTAGAVPTTRNIFISDLADTGLTENFLWGASQFIGLSSTDANDTGAGIGAQQITVNYLTSGFVQKSETITLNGTSIVTSTNGDYGYFISAFVSRVGTNISNVGQILITDPPGTTYYAQIMKANNQTLYGAYSVPAGKNLYLETFCLSATLGEYEFYLSSNVYNAAITNILKLLFVTSSNGAGKTCSLKIPIKFPSGGTFRFYAKAMGATACNAYVTAIGFLE